MLRSNITSLCKWEATRTAYTSLLVEVSVHSCCMFAADDSIITLGDDLEQWILFRLKGVDLCVLVKFELEKHTIAE